MGVALCTSDGCKGVIACTKKNMNLHQVQLFGTLDRPAPQCHAGREEESRRKLDELEKRAPSPLNFTQISKSLFTNLSGPLCI